MPAATSSLTHDLRKLMAFGSGVGVEVGDNGVGLDGVDTSRMFTLSYTTKPEGTGVGLSVSRAIVDAHGGRIWAEPNSEGGASFYFTIPLREAGGDLTMRSFPALSTVS